MQYLFSLWESFWRRWKGTGSDGHWYNSKWFKTICNLVLILKLPDVALTCLNTSFTISVATYVISSEERLLLDI